MRKLLVLVALLGAVVGGCGSADLKPQTTPDPAILPPKEEPVAPGVEDTTGQPVEGDVAVFASPIFRDALLEIKAAFGEGNPKANVTLVADVPTAQLKDRIMAGEPAELFFSDDESAMAPIREANRIDSRSRRFAQGADGASYDSAVLMPSRSLVTARAFQGFVLGIRGQRILGKHGFKT